MIESREVELKLEIAPGDTDALRAMQLLGSPSRAAVQLHTSYFDTPQGDLRRAGYSLRLRRKGRTCIQTVKHRGAESGGFSSRAEWEARVSAEGLDFEALRSTPVADLLSKRDMKRRIERVSETRVARTIWLLRRGKSEIELILDEGEVASGGRAEPISEIELELKKGSARDLFAFAAELGRSVPLRMGVMSKSERGFRLREGRTARARKAEPVRLDRDMSIERAFAQIVQSCLRHFRLNEPLLASRNARALHQARVALRRLRSALTLFKPLIEDRELGRLRGGLRRFTGQLGEARNLDVLLAPDAGARLDEATAKRLRRARREAYAAIRESFAGPEFPRLILDLVVWAEAGEWREGARAAEPVAGFAAERLKKAWKRVRRYREPLAGLDADTRHLLRIEVKRLRYASEFFEGLFSGARKRHQRSFRGELAELQEALGTLNDIETARQLAPDAAAGAAPGDEARSSDLIEAAQNAYDRLVALGPYWR